MNVRNSTALQLKLSRVMFTLEGDLHKNVSYGTCPGQDRKKAKTSMYGAWETQLLYKTRIQGILHHFPKKNAIQ